MVQAAGRTAAGAVGAKRPREKDDRGREAALQALDMALLVGGPRARPKVGCPSPLGAISAIEAAPCGFGDRIGQKLLGQHERCRCCAFGLYLGIWAVVLSALGASLGSRTVVSSILCVALT